MARALELAQQAMDLGEVPIGALVVHNDGTILGEGFNNMEKQKCQTGHAEVRAIEQACQKIGDWRLTECSIYVTLEPCLMCFGLIQLSRLDKLIFGAQSPLFGFGYGNNKNLPLLKKDLVIIEGVKNEECTKLLKHFFQTIRTIRKEKD